MPRERTGPGQLSEDICKFSTDIEKAQSHFLNKNSLEKTSPLSKYIETEHEQAGLFSLSPFDSSLDATLELQKKRRKKCGACTPCLRKENCGTCPSCLNRKIGKQICKLRKCEELKKRQNEWEVEYFEDNGRSCWEDPELVAETVCKVTSVDGPKSGGQMEIGSHDSLQEGTLSLELANGVNSYPNDDETSMETEQQRAGTMPTHQWLSGHCNASDTQQQRSCWNSSRGTKAVHHTDMEDAHNLVAFSNIAGSLPPSSSPSCVVQANTTQLYEKFTQEMSSEGAQVKPSAGAPVGSCQLPEDLNTLQTALSQARHGHKPPNCNCDGLDCPDYLEWLEKKIKLATCEDKGACKNTDSPQGLQPQLQQPHLLHHSQPYPQVNGHCLSTSYPKQQHGPPADQVPCSKPPIPCSPQVLSIAKEKNVSLQTAIAIEALTQLSGTGPQGTDSPTPAPYNSNLHHHQHIQNLPSLSSPSIHSSSSRSQSVPPGRHTSQQAPVACEHHRPQSQGQPANATPLPSSTSSSPFPGQGKHQVYGPNPKQWQQCSGKSSEQKTPWMCMKSEPQPHYATAPHSSSNPMSELKQLLGDTSGKFNNAPFKLAVTQQPRSTQNGSIQGQEHPSLVRIKQEQDSGEHYHCTASVQHYGIANCQQQGQHYSGSPLSPGQAAISHSTQAALQHHLHYKRNLFSNHSTGFGAPGPRTPLVCQNLKKWWPQMETEGFPHQSIKQEPKESKKKRNSQTTPIKKPVSGMLTASPLPKPKQIIIKKTKPKASMPTFLPQTQIIVQKPPVVMMDRALPLTNLQPGTLPSLPVVSDSIQASAADLPAAGQSQVSIPNSPVNPTSIVSAFSENIFTPMGPLPPPVSTVDNTKSETLGSMTNSNTSIPTTLTSTSSSSTSQLPSLTNIDPKYEELIRQFEAEFGDSDTLVSQPTEETAKAPQQGTLSETTSLKSLSTPSILTAQVNSTFQPNNQEMEVNKDKLGMEEEETLNQASTERLTDEEQEEPLHVSLQDANFDKQEQPSLLDNTFSMRGSPLPKRMKIEASGDIAVLSTTCYSEEDTPIKDSQPFSPSVKGFLESPMCYLDTPIKTMLDTPSKDLQAELPTCTCVEHIVEKDEGPYYNHLGSGPTVASIRDLMEMRYGEKGDAIRIEKVIYTGREGKSSRGCPIAKWVVRRGSETEKLLCLVRHRAGHHCANAVIIILIMAWEGVPRAMADALYSELSATLTKYGNPTSRRCGLNDDRTCACQGKDPETCGASFSFGCSWSMYFDGCKYARSKVPRKFRLQGNNPEEEDKVRDSFQDLATEVAPLYKKLAPQAYSNQCQSESKALDCRLGLKEGRPFSGVTACMDFCAHAHKDQQNLHNGCTVVCTLNKEDNREVKKIPEDEQLHVLPLYKMSMTDEFGSEEGMRLKMRTGAIQVLQAFRREVRTLPEPAKSCRQRRLEAKKASSEKKKNKLMQQAGETPEKTLVKAELCVTGSPQPQGNKAIIKQEMKPNIKQEHFNGLIDEYNVQAADTFDSVCPHPAYYAKGGRPPTGQTSAPDPVNGYRHNLATMHNGFYNYPPNALFPRKLRTYEGRNSCLTKAGNKVDQLEKKPDILSLQARLAPPYSNSTEQSNHSGYSQPADYSQSRPSSRSSEYSDRGTPVIKQEPMDMPLCEGTMPNQAGAITPSTTPQPTGWQGHKLNGSIVPTNWDNSLTPKQNLEASLLNTDKQLFNSHPQQQQQQQSTPCHSRWTPYPSSNALMASPAPSPSPQLPLSQSPSPQLGTALIANMHQGSTCPVTPRPNTPRPGTPQPSSSHSRSVTPQPGTPGPGNSRQWVSPAPSPQPNAWAMGPITFNQGLKHINPAGAYPDKMWFKTGESRCSTPLGIQEKTWKSCGGSVASSTPSPAPEGRLFPDSLQQSDWNLNQAESDVESTKGCDHDNDEVWSDSEHNFLDHNIGGVAVAPAHGSILIECARRELHATTPLKKPDRTHPTRISLVFYQHKSLNQPKHGLAQWEAKMKLQAERALQRQQEAALLGLSQEDILAIGKKRKRGTAADGASPGPGQSKVKREGPVTRCANTFHTTSMVTVSPYAFTRLIGPYSHFV